MQIPVKYEAGAFDSNGQAANVLRDIADDLAGIAGTTTAISSPAGSASEASAAVATAITDASGDVGSGALANDLKAKYNAAVTLINELQAKVNLLITLTNELRSDAPGTYALKTTKA